MVFLDDIPIFLHTQEKHGKHIYMAFDRLTQFKSHGKHKECELFSEKVEILGRTILAPSIGVVQTKVDSIK